MKKKYSLLSFFIVTLLIAILASSFIGCTQKSIKPLTDDEKANMIEIALAHPEVSKWLETAVYSTEVGWSAVGWNDSEATGWARLEYEEIADGSLPSDRVFPSEYTSINPDVHIRVGEPAGKYIHVAFDREKQEVVAVQLMPGRPTAGPTSAPPDQTTKSETHTPIPVKDISIVWDADEEAADDIMPTRTYRANGQQEEVENPWLPIESAEVVLDSGLNVSYRDYMETAAGENRNNIIRVRKEGSGPISFESHSQLSLYSIDVPAGLELADAGIRMGVPGTLGTVLVIKIALDVAPGEYPLEIGLMINGKNYGTVTCTVKVVEPCAAGILSEADAEYTGNHGITTTRVTEGVADNGAMVFVNLLPLTVEDLVQESDAIIIGKIIDILPARLETETMVSSKLTVYTTVVIQVEEYLSGGTQARYIAVRVMGGKITDDRGVEMVVRVDASPVFDLGEEVALFLTGIARPNFPPEGFAPANYYSVTGYSYGKFEYRDGIINRTGYQMSISELEEKIAEVHGD